MTTTLPAAPVIIGVDTHKDVHVAVAIDHLGRRLAQRDIPTTRTGLTDLRRWAGTLADHRVWGIEGTSSYGAGLTRDLQAAGESVREVSRPDRTVRRDHGKSDPLDAETAARAVLAGTHLGEPKDTGSTTEALRQIRVTRRAAIKARTQAANQIHALLVTAPTDLRAHLDTSSVVDLVRRCARLRPAHDPTSAREACKLTLRSTARRWLHLTDEIEALTEAMTTAAQKAAPDLLGVFPKKWRRSLCREFVDVSES